MAINIRAGASRVSSSFFHSPERHTVVKRILWIFIVSVLLASLFLLPRLYGETRKQGESALLALEQFIQGTARQLRPLIQSGRPDCSAAVVTHLRRQVFGFSRVKEIGLYGPDFTVYCVSNDGAVEIVLPPVLRTRLEVAHNGQTLWLTKAKVSDTSALFIYIRDAQGMGANVLMSPAAVSEVVGHALMGSELAFQLNVLGEVSERSRQGEPGLFASKQVFQSLKYPLTLTLQQTRQSQLSFWGQHLWVGLLLGSFCSLIYLYTCYLQLRRNAMRVALQRALVTQELHICYQPVMDYHQNCLMGLEVLLHWQDPCQGSIGPDVVIALAERLNMIEPVTGWVLDEVSTLITDHSAELSGCYVSVSVSRYHLLNYDLAALIQQRCQQVPALSRYLVLELAGDCAFSDSEQAHVIRQLKALQGYGIRLTAAECGSGCAGMAFIQRYPFDMLKLERAFIKRLGNDRALVSLFESVVWEAQRRGMTVIAEGVEQAGQAASLTRLGVVLMQGDLLARPVPQLQLLQWLARRGGSDDGTPLLIHESRVSLVEAAEAAQAEDAQHRARYKQPEQPLDTD